MSHPDWRALAGSRQLLGSPVSGYDDRTGSVVTPPRRQGRAARITAGRRRSGIRGVPPSRAITATAKKYFRITETGLS